MKADKFQTEDDTACGLCALHENFGKQIDYIPCPSCDSPIEIPDNLTVVGEHNSSDTKNITKVPVLECESCGKTIAFLPTVIHYNANHDVYYTGEPCYLEDEDDKEIIKRVRANMAESVKQFVDRVKAGETDLTDYYLNMWMERDVARALAGFLYEKGYKRKIAPPKEITEAEM
jgi:hypothetical protein